MEITEEIREAVLNSKNNSAQERNEENERFEFDLFINDDVICKRLFRIDDFIEESINTIDFKEKMDSLVKMIDRDLKSKTRVYTWYNFYHATYQLKQTTILDENDKERIIFFTEEEPVEVPSEFSEPLLEPWECTFKIVVMDGTHPIYTKIWDGGTYVKAVRKNYDITNKWVKWSNKDGKNFAVLKESYFKDNNSDLSPKMSMLKAMIMDKPKLSNEIIRKICGACSVKKNGYHNITDYTSVVTYKTRDPKTGKVTDEKKYKLYSYGSAQNDKQLEKSLAKKTKNYFNNLDI